MKKITLFSFLFAMLLTTIPTDAGCDDFNRILSVIGQGKATAAPDMATILTGVVTESASAMEALSANNEAMDNILGTLKTYKIAKKDVQTVHFNVSPQYKRDERGRRQTEIVGYQAMNQLSVKVRNLGELGKVLDALIRSGSNQVSGVNFGIDDPSTVLNLARNRAIANARSRAELYAQAAGVRVGKVFVISEQPVEPLRPKAFRQSFAAESISAVPMEIGEQTVHVKIHMTFGIEDKQ